MNDITKDPQLLFVYGTLKRGFGANYMVANKGNFKGVCATKGLLLDLGSFPGMVKHEVCLVTGEVYEVDWGIIETTDSYESAPQFYHRRQIATPWGLAWAYYKNQAPTLNDSTLCAARGVWLGAAHREPYKDVLDYFQNKRWLEPKYRIGPQPAINCVPESGITHDNVKIILKSKPEPVPSSAVDGNTALMLPPPKKEEAPAPRPFVVGPGLATFGED